MTEQLDQRLLTLMRRHGIAELDVREGNLDLSLRLPLAPVDAASFDTITAPFAGQFLAQHPALPAAPRGPRSVRQGAIIGFLKSGALLRPLVAKADCQLSAPKVADGTLVGYGDVLFEINA